MQTLPCAQSSILRAENRNTKSHFLASKNSYPEEINSNILIILIYTPDRGCISVFIHNIAARLIRILKMLMD